MRTSLAVGKSDYHVSFIIRRSDIQGVLAIGDQSLAECNSDYLFSPKSGWFPLKGKRGRSGRVQQSLDIGKSRFSLPATK
ncbi:MAG: hypothetical protein AAF399_16670 [Bacteroidota bacterium]